MLTTALTFVGVYFSMLMVGVAMILAVASTAISRRVPRLSFAEQLFRWVALFGSGIVGIYCAAVHILAPEEAAKTIGWEPSPFQYEVGMADFTVGVLGIVAFFYRDFGFRLAATIAAVCWLGGDAVGHIRQIIIAENFSPGNAGPWLWSDILVPLLMVVTLMVYSRQRRSTVASVGE